MIEPLTLPSAPDHVNHSNRLAQKSNGMADVNILRIERIDFLVESMSLLLPSHEFGLSSQITTTRAVRLLPSTECVTIRHERIVFYSSITGQFNLPVVIECEQHRDHATCLPPSPLHSLPMNCP
jgi:hypothetical protein